MANVPLCGRSESLHALSVVMRGSWVLTMTKWVRGRTIEIRPNRRTRECCASSSTEYSHVVPDAIDHSDILWFTIAFFMHVYIPTTLMTCFQVLSLVLFCFTQLVLTFFRFHVKTLSNWRTFHPPDKYEWGIRNYLELSWFILSKHVFIRFPVYEWSLYRRSPGGRIPGE